MSFCIQRPKGSTFGLYHCLQTRNRSPFNKHRVPQFDLGTIKLHPSAGFEHDIESEHVANPDERFESDGATALDEIDRPVGRAREFTKLNLR